MHPLVVFAFLLYSSISSAIAAQVFSSDTVDIRNNTPLAMLFSLPRADFYKETPVARGFLKVDFGLSNYFSNGVTDTGQLKLDGETWSLRKTISYPINKELQLHASTSWIKHSGGISDRFIYHFHDILGLPQNGRSDSRVDKLDWRLVVDGTQVIHLDDEQSSLGDTEIGLTWKPSFLDDFQVNSLIKLPTGNAEHLSGSNSFDLSLSISKQNPTWFKERSIFPNQSLSLWYGGGIGYLGEAKVLEDLTRKPVVASLRGGLAWLATPRWTLKSQLDLHSPLYDSEFRELGWIPIQISFESTYDISQDISINAVIGEDLRPRTVPDITFSTGLIARF